MMYLVSLTSTLASAKTFVSVTRVGALVIVSSLVWHITRTAFSVNTKPKSKLRSEVFAM